MFRSKLFLAVAVALLGGTPVCAASLQVQPALVDVMAPGAASTITLRNTGPTPINVQVRVFRWSQIDGEEHLEPTENVVASPPAVTLAPNTDYVARIVRIVKQPVVGEEAYRLFIDELPDAAQSKTNAIKLLVRHSIPVFFAGQDRTAPDVDWSILRRGDRVVLAARNNGGSRLRLSALSLRDQAGRSVALGTGLVGYALSRSTMRWVLPAAGRSIAASGPVSISATGNEGPIRATASVGGGR